MATELFPANPAFTVNGPGPYPVVFPYGVAADIVVTVTIGTTVTQLAPSAWSVQPEIAANDGGSLTLDPGIAETYDAGALKIDRWTVQEQGWVAVDGPREEGLEAQLDRLMRAVQDLSRRPPPVSNEVASTDPRAPFVLRPGEATDSFNLSTRYAVNNGLGYFYRDPADTTTVEDGVTCLVDNAGNRFLRTNAEIAAIEARTGTPPANPALGQAWIVTAPATGAFAGKVGSIMLRTARGWLEIDPQISARWVIAERAWYVCTGNRQWQKGVGDVATRSIAARHLIHPAGVSVQGVRFNPPDPVIEHQAWIVGTGATGAWAGFERYLAVGTAAGTWDMIAPYVGAVVDDNAAGGRRRYTSGAWRPAGLTDAVAYANFNGASMVVRASANVASVQRQGTGLYLITFAEALRDQNYLVTCGWGGAAHSLVCVSMTGGGAAVAKTVTEVQVSAFVGDTLTDLVEIYVECRT